MGLADTLGIDIDEANRIMEKVLGAMPQLKKAIKLTEEFASRYGYVETISGHTRRLPDAKGGDRRLKSRSLRQSFNAVIQGSGAYCTNNAVILVRNALRKYKFKSKLVNTVHDSLVLDVHPDEIKTVPALVKAIMEHLPINNFILNLADFPTLKVDDKYKISDTQFRFPLIANVEWGRSYGDGFDWEPDIFNKIGIDAYYNMAVERKNVDVILGPQIKSTDDPDEKQKLEDEYEAKMKEIDNKYNLN